MCGVHDERARSGRRWPLRPEREELIWENRIHPLEVRRAMCPGTVPIGVTAGIVCWSRGIVPPCPGRVQLTQVRRRAVCQLKIVVSASRICQLRRSCVQEMSRALGENGRGESLEDICASATIFRMLVCHDLEFGIYFVVLDPCHRENQSIKLGAS